MLAHDADEVLAACREVGAPASVIFSVPDIMRDPQYAAVGAIATVDDADLGPLRMANTPFRLSATPPRIQLVRPALGEHTDEVLGALGLAATSWPSCANVGRRCDRRRRAGPDNRWPNSTRSCDESSNWGRWGADDDLGTVNLLTAERAAAAAAEVALRPDGLARAGRCTTSRRSTTRCRCCT